MLIFITFLAFILIFTLINILFSRFIRKSEILNRRLDEISSSKIQDLENQDSFIKKISDGINLVIENRISKNAKENRNEKLTRRLESAGFAKSVTTVKYLSNKIKISLFLTLISFMIVFLLSKSIVNSIIFTFIILFLYLYITNFLLSVKITRRKKMMLKDLPYTLDLILVSVEAGLSFDGAISKVIGNINGPLSEEFSKTLKEIRMGIERKTALRNMSIRCALKELSTFLTSVIQADELGVALSKIIRIEAASLREERKQRARERAMKAPVKLLIPLLLFIFPTIFIVILGPAMIQIMEFFK
jgi:tight adherence protein C